MLTTAHYALCSGTMKILNMLGDVLHIKDRTKGNKLFGHEISHPNGIIFFPYQQINEILGTSPSRMLEYNVVFAAVYSFKTKFDCTDNKMDLNDIPLSRGAKCTTVSSFRKVLVRRPPYPVQTVFGRGSLD